MRGAWLVTMETPSSGQETTAALVLAQMVPRADASLPVAAIKTLLLYSLPVSVILDTLAPDATSVPQASLAIPQMWGGHVSLAIVTTTSTQRTQKPATRRPGGASSAYTTRRGSSASSAASDTMATRSARTVASVSAITWARCRNIVTALTAGATQPRGSASASLT